VASNTHVLASLLHRPPVLTFNPAPPEETLPEERKGSPVCVVSHPDAGGPCGRPPVGEVWGLPFCEAHGREAELAAREEMANALEGIFRGLQAVEQERHERNETAVEIIEEAAASCLTSDPLAYEEAMAQAYPPEKLVRAVLGADADLEDLDTDALGGGRFMARVAVSQNGKRNRVDFGSIGRIPAEDPPF
jgi:hypothetical protein